MIEATRARVLQQSLPTDFDPSAIALLEHAGITPDPWQRQLATSAARRMLLLCARQSGKSSVTAAMVLSEALRTPDALVLVVSASERQAKEYLVDKVLKIFNANGRPLATGQESTLHLTLANGSRILALPSNEATLRGFSGARLIVLDEAARISDDLYYSLRPMLAVSGGQLIAMSTPFGQRGWFYQEYTDGGGDWERVKITADQCPRITPEFLEEERRRLPAMWYNSEYLCQFTATIDAVFALEHIQAAVSPTLAAFPDVIPLSRY